MNSLPVGVSLEGVDMSVAVCGRLTGWQIILLGVLWACLCR